MSTDPRPAVLADINCIRIRSGRRALSMLPPGVMCDPGECPLQRPLRKIDPTVRVYGRTIACGRALALRLSVLWDKPMILLEKGQAQVELPSYYQNFIARFDQGEWPGLILEVPAVEMIIPDRLPVGMAEEYLIPA